MALATLHVNLGDSHASHTNNPSAVEAASRNVGLCGATLTAHAIRVLYVREGHSRCRVPGCGGLRPGDRTS